MENSISVGDTVKSKYTGENFYVVRGLGVVRDYPTNDKEVKLRSGQYDDTFLY